MKKIFFILFFISLIFVAVFFIAFLFTALTTLFIFFALFFIFSLIFLILFVAFDKIKKILEKKGLTKYYKQKRNKEREMKELETLFFKREMSEEIFKKTRKDIARELFEIDAKIRISQISIATPEDEIKEKIKLLTKNYLSKKMSEDLFQELYAKYARALATKKSNKINETLDRKIKREILNIKREKEKK